MDVVPEPSCHPYLETEISLVSLFDGMDFAKFLANRLCKPVQEALDTLGGQITAGQRGDFFSG